jgi:acyl-coenzyme A synthetase/AMP-(fatty) acid ligase
MTDKLLGYIKELRAGIVFVDSIPKSSVGKINRKYFKQLVSNEVIKTL